MTLSQKSGGANTHLKSARLVGSMQNQGMATSNRKASNEKTNFFPIIDHHQPLFTNNNIAIFENKTFPTHAQPPRWSARPRGRITLPCKLGELLLVDVLFVDTFKPGAVCPTNHPKYKRMNKTHQTNRYLQQSVITKSKSSIACARRMIQSTVQDKTDIDIKSRPMPKINRIRFGLLLELRH